MADSLGLPANHWFATNSETSHASPDFVPLPVQHDTQDVSCSNRINEAESIRFNRKFSTLATASFEPGDLCTAKYFTKPKQVTNDRPWHLSEQPIIWINATEDV
jgi:hypothetical protein